MASIGGGLAVRHGDALAGGETVELDDDRPVEFAPPGDRGVVVVEHGEPRAGNAERGGEVACVRLRRLEPGQFGGRSEARDATTRALVGDTGDERSLGAREHQVGVVGRSHRRDPARAGRRGRDAGTPRRSPVRAPPPPITSTRISGSPPARTCPSREQLGHLSGPFVHASVEVGHARTPSKASLAWASPTWIGYLPVKQPLQ